MDNARSNLFQWFDDAKKDLISTGLVINKEVLNEEGGIVSEVQFSQRYRTSNH
jgi:hypothetical protein